jgi:O-antigen ligase
MMVVSLSAMLLATLVACAVAVNRPQGFALFLIPIGVCQFGADLEGAGGLANTSAIWLLLLIVVCLGVMLNIGAASLKLNTPEVLYLLFLGWCLFEAARAHEHAYAARSFLRLLFPFASMYIARRTVRSVGRAERLVRYQYIATLCVSLLHWGAVVLPALFYAIANVGIVWFGAVFFDQACIVTLLALACWKVRRDLRSLALAGMLAALCFAATNRTTLLALVAGGSIFCLLEFRRLAILLLPALYLCLGAIVMLVPSVRQKMFYQPDKVQSGLLLSADVLANKQFNDDGRYAMWTEVMNRFFWHCPLLGSGLGATQAWFYTGGAEEALHTRLKVEHSEYIKLAADTGIVGLGLYVAMHLSAWGTAWLAYRRSTHEMARVFSVAALCVLPAFWVCMAFDNALLYVLPVAQLPTAFAAIASSLSLSRGDTPRGEIRPQPQQVRLLPRRRIGQRFASPAPAPA